MVVIVEIPQHKKGGRRMNRNKLRGRIVEKFETQEQFAQVIGTTPGTVSKKLKNTSSMKREEIARWCELLEISPDDIYMYFFDD